VPSNTATANVLSTLRLFAQKEGRLVVADVMQQLGVSNATAYRYLAELEEAGLVSRFALGEYVLGPEIVALDRAARAHDPYVAAAQPVMMALAQETRATVLLGRPCGGRLVFVLDVPGPLGPRSLTDARGRSELLRCSALSRVAPARAVPLEQHRIEHPSGGPSEQASGPCSTPAAEAGAPDLQGGKICCCTDGELEPDALLWSAAIRRGKHVVGSLGLAFRREASPKEPARIVDRLWRAALRIEGRLKAQRSG